MILAEAAVKIAADSRQRISQRSGMVVIERLFFNRVDARRSRFAVNQAKKFSIPILADFTNTQLVRLDSAVVAAEPTLNALLLLI